MVGIIMDGLQAVLTAANIIVIAAVAINGQRQSRQSSAEATQIAKHKLWLELMPRRMDWFKDTTKAFYDAIAPLKTFPKPFKAEKLDKQGLYILYRQYEDASWLFEAQVQEVVGDIIDLISIMYDEAIMAPEYGSTAYQDFVRQQQSSLTVAQEKLTSITEKLREYLYVGAIKQDVPQQGERLFRLSGR